MQRKYTHRTGMLGADVSPATTTPSSNGQTHDHEFLGSVKIAERNIDPHNHRFAGVTSEVIPLPGGSHKHVFCTNTDFYEDHHHEIAAETGPAIPVSPNRHVHYIMTLTTIDEGHFHEAMFATLINDPIGD